MDGAVGHSVKRLFLMGAVALLVSWGLVAPAGAQRTITADGGRTATPQTIGGWITLYPPKAPLQAKWNDVCFVDGRQGWVVGDGGAILTTADAGQTWVSQQSGTSFSLTSVWFTDAQHGWVTGGVGAMGDRALLLHTDDGGSTWTDVTPVTLSTSYGLSEVQFVAPQLGFLFGQAEDPAAAGSLHVTEDGVSWQPRPAPAVPTPTRWGDHIQAMSFADGQHGWVVGERVDEQGMGTLPAILATRDGGLSWVDQSPAFRGRLYGVAFTDTLNGWAVGLFDERADRQITAAALQTTDGGQTWSRRRLDERLGSVFFDVGLTPEGYGWIACSGMAAYVTFDGGSTWTARPRPSWRAISSIAIVRPGLAYMAGDNIIFGLDSSGPRTVALEAARVRQGRTATLKYQVNEDWPCAGEVAAFIRIRTASRKVVKELPLGGIPVNTPLSKSFVCSLQPGTYQFTVYAEDPADNAQASTKSQTLTVR